MWFGLRDGLMVLMFKVGLIWKFTALLQLNVALWRELVEWIRRRSAPRLFNRRAARSSTSRPLRSIAGNQFASSSNLFIHGFISNCEDARAPHTIQVLQETYRPISFTSSTRLADAVSLSRLAPRYQAISPTPTALQSAMTKTHSLARLIQSLHISPHMVRPRRGRG